VRNKIILIILILLAVNFIYAKDILISFDGSGYFDVWQETLDYAKANNVKFTYFVSAPYFISGMDMFCNTYWAETEIGPPLLKIIEAKYYASVTKRRNYAFRAIAEGHEIASHLCGHYNGRNWTYGQWMKEFEFFEWAMTTAGFKKEQIMGVRAPYLAVNDDYFKALIANGYLYDSSCGRLQKCPDDGKYVEVPIKSMKVITNYTIMNGTKYVIPFDDAFEREIANQIEWLEMEEYRDKSMEDIYFDSLCNDYLNSPYPTQICLHFEKPRQDSVLNIYWAATKRFIEWVRDKDPQYKTYFEYAVKKGDIL